MTEDLPDVERIGIEEIPLTLVVNYHDLPTHPADMEETLLLSPGLSPFILMQMQQVDGSVQCQITASQIPGEDDLIETLEVFLTALVEDRSARLQARMAEEVDKAIEEHLDEELTRANEDATIRDIGGR